MAKKFDTNPLDPAFPEKVKTAETTTLPNSNGQTQNFVDAGEDERQTRKFNEARFGSFENSFDQGPGDAGNYAPARVYPEVNEQNKTHRVGSINLPENVLMALPYIPFWIGLVAGVIELFLVPKSEPKVRYHAAQGVAAHVGILIVTTVLGLASIGTDLAELASGIFWLVTTIMLLIFAFKAWKGKPIHIETVESLTDWLEEKVKPQN